MVDIFGDETMSDENPYRNATQKILGDAPDILTYPVNGVMHAVQFAKPTTMSFKFFSADCDVVLSENADGYLCLEGTKIEEAAKLFFEHVVQLHALELSRQSRQIKELEEELRVLRLRKD